MWMMVYECVYLVQNKVKVIILCCIRTIFIIGRHKMHERKYSVQQVFILCNIFRLYQTSFLSRHDVLFKKKAHSIVHICNNKISLPPFVAPKKLNKNELKFYKKRLLKLLLQVHKHLVSFPLLSLTILRNSFSNYVLFIRACKQ